MENTATFCEDFAADVVETLKSRGFDVSCYKTNKVYKVNDEVHNTLVIQDDHFQCSPAIYLDHYEKLIENGTWTREMAIEHAAKIYVKSKESEFVANAEGLDLASDARFTIRMLNINRNKHYLSDTPVKMITDELALYIRGIVDTGESDSEASFKVTNAMIEAKGLDVDELFDEAFKNLKEEEFTINTITSVLEGFGVCISDEMDCPEGYEIPVYVATSKNMVQGACVLARKDILDKFAKEHGDFYILPSSVHELIFAPANITSDVSELSKMVHSVNVCELNDEDYLSDTVYMYSKEGLKAM